MAFNAADFLRENPNGLGLDFNYTIVLIDKPHRIDRKYEINALSQYSLII